MKPIIFAPQPAPGDAIHLNSLFADYKRGIIGLEMLNWSWLCGLEIYQAPDYRDVVLAECVYEDVEEWLDDIGEADSFIEALASSPKAFLDVARDLNIENLAALEVLQDRVPDPVAFVRGRALDAVLR